MSSGHVVAARAEEFVATLADESVALLAIDPPYYGIAKKRWDHAWSDVHAYVDWFVDLLEAYWPKLTPDGSLVFFGGIGKARERGFFRVVLRLDESRYTYRNIVTIKKRRGYGKPLDYLFCREEVAWYSKSAHRTAVRFNVPLTEELRGYAGFAKRYPAKSPYKRVSNVWSDLGELMRPEYECQKPVPWLQRLVTTHSHPGDLVVDCFAGWGTTGVACAATGRRFRGCDDLPDVAAAADARVAAAFAAAAVTT